MSIADFSAAQKEEFATSLAALLIHDAGVDASAENLNGALAAAGVKVSAYLPTLYASAIERGLKVSKALAGPSSGGAAAGGAAPAAGAAAPAKKEEKEEEEEMDMGGGMDMFGGSSDY